MQRKPILLAGILLLQLVWVGTINGSSGYSVKYLINYDSDFRNFTSYWANSTWNPHGPADNWMKADNETITLYYKANRTHWGNTEAYQGKQPNFNITKSLRFRDYLYEEGSGGLRLIAKVKRDTDPIWQSSSEDLTKSPFPQANIGIYLWLEVKGWNYDDTSKTSSLVVDVYFDSRRQDPDTNETITTNIDVLPSFQNTTPYDPQIHVGFVKGILPLNSWQVFNVSISTLIDQSLQECRNKGIALPYNEVFVKFLGVCVDSLIAAVQASFDYVLLKDTINEEIEKQLNSATDQIENITKELDSTRIELQNARNLMYVFMTAAIVFLATTLYFATRKPKKERAVKTSCTNEESGLSSRVRYMYTRLAKYKCLCYQPLCIF